MDSTEPIDREYDVPCGLMSISSPPEHKVLLKCPIAGLGYYDLSDIGDELHVGAEQALVHEKHNKYGKNAVVVAFANDYDGDAAHFDFNFNFSLRYVPKASNAVIAPCLTWAGINLLKPKSVISSQNPLSIAQLI